MMKLRSWLASAVVVVSVGAGSLALAKGNGRKHQPKLTLAQAQATALAKVDGKVVHHELEKEKGRWIYSIEIRPTGEKGKAVKEVNVDSDSGEIVNVEDERE